MAAFLSLYQQQHEQVHHFNLLDSVFLIPNSPTSSSSSNINKMYGLLEESNNNNVTHQQFYQQDQTNFPQNNIEHSPNESSVLSLPNMDSSSDVTHNLNNLIATTTTNTTTPNPMEKKKRKSSSVNSAAQMKGKKEKKMKQKMVEEKKSNSIKEEGKKKKKGIAIEEVIPTGYIHVRARRGQATDSHSLAERVRRERISERMKLLQALVPGCDKVTGKALMLDEIINYVQSLQNQVEFLSMKLASVNPMFYDFGMDLESFMVKPDQDLNSLPSAMATMQPTSPTSPNVYSLLDINNSENSLMYPNNSLPQVNNNRQILWEVEDEQRQKMINQTGFNFIN